ncbi:MAG: GIY-YIG nuclease family protein [Candidatus Helarchaeota archaeon]
MGKYYVYIVRCTKDNSLYTGYTSDLARRLEQHNRGQGAKYTKCRKPVFLLYHEEYETRKEAMRRERQIKRYSRKQKLHLIKLNEINKGCISIQ